MNPARRKWETPHVAKLDNSQAATGAGSSFEQFCTAGGPYSSGFGGKLAYCVSSMHHVYSMNTSHRNVFKGCFLNDSKSANACAAGS
jgi:hypothetical protein